MFRRDNQAQFWMIKRKKKGKNHLTAQEEEKIYSFIFSEASKHTKSSQNIKIDDLSQGLSTRKSSFEATFESPDAVIRNEDSSKGNYEMLIEIEELEN